MTDTTKTSDAPDRVGRGYVTEINDTFFTARLSVLEHEYFVVLDNTTVCKEDKEWFCVGANITYHLDTGSVEFIKERWTAQEIEDAERWAEEVIEKFQVNDQGSTKDN